MCPFFCNIKEKFFRHLVRRHKHTPNFIIHCSVHGCGASYTKVGAFRVHLLRKHHKTPINFDNDTLDNDENDIGNQEEDYHEMEDENDLHRKIMDAQFILRLRAQFSLPQAAIDEILLSTKTLVSDRFKYAKQKLINCIPDGTLSDNDISEIFANRSFAELENEYLQEKFFQSHLGYVKPKSVKLGECNIQKKVIGIYKFISKDVLGFYVPFKEQLRQLLSMPEVQESLKTPTIRNIDFEYGDIYDGIYFQKEFFQQHQNILLFSIYYDNFEIVNPIGSHKKKHKLSVFYWNLLNLPPDVRFKVQATQLLAVAKTLFKKILECQICLEILLKICRI